MDSLIGEIIGSSNTDDIKYAIEVLKSRPTYDNYFTSQPQPGSIIEDIAELDASIANLEKELKKELLAEKDSIINILLNSTWSTSLHQISEQIEQLWELNEGAAKNAKEFNTKDIGDLSEPEFSALDEEIEEEYDIESEANDAFHEALSRLRELNGAEHDTSIGLIISNLANISDILELPTLVSSCIRTGHYQEALMLHSYAKTLMKKFPGFQMIKSVSEQINTLISTKMLNGLVRLLATNLTLGSMKKVLSYLEAVEPFEQNAATLQQLFLTMRYKFVCNEIDSYSITEETPITVKEMLIKRKIECVREHVYGTISVFTSLFEADCIPILLPELPQSEQSEKKHVDTPLVVLKFLNECVNFLIAQICAHKQTLTDSVCLQLIYCSFRLGDANPNYHHLFVNKLLETDLFSLEAINSAISKRLELVTRY